MAHCASALGCRQGQCFSQAVARRVDFKRPQQQQQQQKKKQRRRQQQQKQQQLLYRRQRWQNLQSQLRCQCSAQGELSHQQQQQQQQLQPEGLWSNVSSGGIRQRRSRNKLRKSVVASVSGNIAAAAGQQNHYNDDVPAAVMSALYGAPRWNLEEGRQYYEDMLFHRGPLYQVE